MYICILKNELNKKLPNINYFQEKKTNLEEEVNVIDTKAEIFYRKLFRILGRYVDHEEIEYLIKLVSLIVIC